MDKILKIALLSKGFDNDCVSSLLEVCNETGNAVVAIEKILGIYEMPEIPATSNSLHKDKRLCSFISFNPFKEKVTYSYKEQRTIYDDTLKKHVVVENEFKTVINDVSLKDWINGWYH